MRLVPKLCAVAIVAALLPGLAVAEETKMTGVEVSEALTDRTAIYEGDVIRQFFAKSGSTPYWDGSRLTHGSWRVTGDQYCSVWPPQNVWACYDMFWTEDGGVVWVGKSGDRYPARMVDGDQMAAQ